MTLEQYERGIALRERIDRLEETLEKFKEVAATMDDSLVRMSGFSIYHNMDMLMLLNNAELMFMIESFEREINRLENEFRRV